MQTHEVMRAIERIHAMSEAIREAGSIPSGHLYGMLCGAVCYEEYTAAIRILKNAKLVKETNNLLEWIGPVLS